MPSADEFLSNYEPSSNPVPSGAQSADDFLSQYAPTKQKPIDRGIGRTALDQTMQGATFGLSDEISDRLGAFGAKAYDKIQSGFDKDKQLFRGRSVGDLVNEDRPESKTRLQDEFETRPALTIGSNLAGGLLTGGAGGETEAGTAIANSLRSGSLGARIGKGALAGAAGGATYGAGTADEGHRLEGATTGLVYGAVTGGALPAVGSALSDVAGTLGNTARGLIAKSPEKIQNAAESMKGVASALYDKMRDVGAVFNSQSGGTLFQGIDKALAKRGFIPENNQYTVNIVNAIRKKAADGELSLGDLDQYRSQLYNAPHGHDTVAAGDVRSAIDDFVNNAEGKDLASGSTDAVDLLNQGRKQYQQASKFSDVSDILTKANGDPNKIKNGLTRFLQNDNNTRGWSDEEVAALKDAASSSNTEKLLKLGGKFGLDTNKGLIGNIGAGAAAYGAGPAGPIAGTAAGFGQKLAAKGKAQNLLNTLQGKGSSPLEDSISGLLAAPAGAGAAEYENQQQLPPPSIQPHMIPQPQTMTRVTPMNYTAQVPASPEGLDVSSFAKAESGGNPNAQSKTSSASGLFGFTNKTWADLVSKYGKGMGINLGDKNNPDAQKQMVQVLARENLQYLNKTLGRLPSKAELYFAHVFGGNGAAKLINADPQREAVTVFPRNVVDANRNIFFNGKQPRTVADVQQLLASKI